MIFFVKITKDTIVELDSGNNFFLHLMICLSEERLNAGIVRHVFLCHTSHSILPNPLSSVLSEKAFHSVALGT